ncbi:MAG: tetratricopeptide repeat protein [Spirochaetales bacterium]|nr:tetratricopeptide repeat protein [Spirochaetales bacterium]
MKRTFFIIFLLFSLSAFANSDNFKSGQLYLAYNLPSKAIPFFQEEISQNPDNIDAYLFLGLCFEMEKQHMDAIDVLKRASFRAENIPLIHYNIGNNYFSLGQYQAAKEAYTKALEIDSQYYNAYLNRANASFKLNEFGQAIFDYKSYISIYPEAPQRAKIEQLILMLEQKIADIEKQRQLEIQRQKEEEERQRQLLEELLGSVQDPDSGVSVDDNTPEGYDLEFDIVE